MDYLQIHKTFIVVVLIVVVVVLIVGDDDEKTALEFSSVWKCIEQGIQSMKELVE